MKSPNLGMFFRKIRIVISPRSTLLRTRLSNGALVEGQNRRGYGGRGAYLFRDAIEPELLHLQRMIKPGDVFVDIGANVGVFSVKAAKIVGDQGMVIAIEPFIETAYRLHSNIRLNKFRNVRIRNLCIGRETEQSTLYMNDGKPNSFGLYQRAQAEAVSILTVSLDDLCRWEGLQRLDFLKIDAEGAEREIIQGAAESIRAFRPIIQVETNICPSMLPAAYRQFASSKSPNHLFVPDGRREVIQSICSLGWAEIDHEGSPEKVVNG